MKQALVLVTLLLLGISLIRPIYLSEQSLQHAPTVIAIAFLAIDSRKNQISRTSFVCVTLFLWLHILGARYIYSFVPYDAWSFRLIGTPISDWFDWNRNHYDRLVHFLFGILCIIPAAELGEYYGKLSRKWALGFAMLAVLSVSALYEVFEWLLTVVMVPQHAEAYNGQQGDIWDAQKDMALAFCGAALMVGVLVLCHYTRKTT